MKLRVCYSEHKVSPGEVFNLTSPPQPRSYHVCTTCSSKGHGHMLGLKLKPPSLPWGVYFSLAGRLKHKTKGPPLAPKNATRPGRLNYYRQLTTTTHNATRTVAQLSWPSIENVSHLHY